VAAGLLHVLYASKIKTSDFRIPPGMNLTLGDCYTVLVLESYADCILRAWLDDE